MSWYNTQPAMQVHQSQNARLSQRDSLPSFDKILERKKFYSSTHKLAITKFPEKWARNKFTNVHRKVITIGLRNWRQSAMISRNGILPSFDDFLGKKKFYSPTPKLVITKFAEVNNRLQWVRNKFNDVHRKVITKIPTVCEFVPITNLGQDKCQVSDKESNTDATKEKIQITSVLENSKITNLEKFPKITNLEKFQNKDLQKIYTTNNIIKIWQDPNFLITDTGNNTIYAKNNLESKMIDNTFLCANRMNFPLTTNMKTNNPIRESLKNITRRINNHSDILTFDGALKALELQTLKNNKTISRKYSFCYGHIPYTANFNIFASGSQEQEITDKTDKETLEGIAPKGNPGFHQDFKRPRTMMDNITKTIQESTTYPKQSNDLQDDTYRNIIPNIGFPWKPRNRLLTEHLYTAYHQDTLLMEGKSPPSLRQPKNKDSNEEKENTHIQNNHTQDQTLYSNILQDDIRSIMDREVDKTQDFNDNILLSNGFKIFSFMKTSMNSQIYAGAMITELKPGIFMYTCKPCDMAGFNQTKLLPHLATPKHQDNTNTWIQQHYILHEPQFSLNDKEPSIRLYASSLQGSNSELIFNNMMEIIGNQAFFPTQHKVNVTLLITKFCNATNKMDIQFIPAFKKDTDDQGHNHWIISAFENKNNREIIIKSPAQRMEIETIADFARLLFKILVECNFIPTNYLIILAIIMCQNPTLDYPDSKSELFNSHYIDLLLEEGTIILAEEEKSMKQENCNTEETIHNKQNSIGDIEAPNQKCIQLLPEDKCREFIEHCNSISFNWKLTTIGCFKLQLIYNLKLHMQHTMKQRKYIKSLAEKQAILPPISRNVEEGQNTYPPISRDVKDGNYPNYCQSPNYEVIKSKRGSPLYNYCGLPSHKRQNCLIKRDDRRIGLTRINHPNKKKYRKGRIKKPMSSVQWTITKSKQ